MSGNGGSNLALRCKCLHACRRRRFICHIFQRVNLETELHWSQHGSVSGRVLAI